MSRLLLLFPGSQAWDFRTRRAKINLSRNHGENEQPFGHIPYIVELFKENTKYCTFRADSTPLKTALSSPFSENFLSY
jgi:hypothetical protein